MIGSRIKYILKRILTTAGINLRSRPPRAGMAEAMTHVAKQFNPATIIDVGVADGTYALYDAFPKAELLLIEPMTEFDSAIQEILKRRKGIYFNGAAGDSVGQARVGYSGSLLDAHHSRILNSDNGLGTDAPLIQRTVRVNRVDEIVLENNLKGPFLIKVDVEGLEDVVIKGCLNILDQTELIILETAFFKFDESRMVFHEILAYMATLDFIPYDIFDLSLRPLDSSLALCDVAFVKANGRFRNSNLFMSDFQVKRLRASWKTNIRKVIRV